MNRKLYDRDQPWYCQWYGLPFVLVPIMLAYVAFTLAMIPVALWNLVIDG